MNTKAKTVTTIDDQAVSQPQATPIGGVTKESEPETVDKVQIRAESALDRDLSEATKSITEHTKLPHEVHQPNLAADVEDAGVFAPQAAADGVISHGQTLNIETDEATYKKGLHTRVVGKVVNRAIVGVSSLAAFALWIGRMIKIAHKKTMKVVFRKAGENHAD